MTTRRIFIQAAAGSALPASVALRASGTPTRHPADFAAIARRELGAIVIESGHGAAEAFGDHFRGRGAKLLSVREGDVTGVWLSSIRPLWSRRRAPVAGLTSQSALFCLEQLAWQHGLRVVFHAEHILLPDGRLTHHVQRDPRMARLTASNLQRAGVHWPLRLAEAMAAQGASPGRRPGPSIAAMQPPLPEGATLLTSWIIAAA